jgi:hypothetical protein
MKHRFVSLMLACLTLSVGSWAVTSAEPVVPAAPGDVEILINGMPQRRYAAQSPIAHSASARSPHEQRWYVEALKGREYAVRIHNPYPGRVAVALSVDGLNTIDARHTAAGEARKWVLSPHETITISGWQVNSREARRFEFTTEEKSYGQVLGQTANLGTISAVFFKERASSIADGRLSGAGERSSNEIVRVEPRAPSPAGERAGATAADKRSADEYAATGMGQRTGHAVTQVWLDLENTPAQTVNIRYEFRAQLVRLGILQPPRDGAKDPLKRREDARGFEGGFAPEIAGSW